MSYIVEQEIKGNIYLYSVDSYWDKTKKQSRQRRTYLGPKNRRTKTKKSLKCTNIIHKNYGNTFLLNKIAKKTGLQKILTSIFPDNFTEIWEKSWKDFDFALPGCENSNSCQKRI
jgi:hypothetical protein